MTVREQAIRILAVCASTIEPLTFAWDARREMGYAEAAERLAAEAFAAAFVAQSSENHWELYAEGECLLRTGWEPNHAA